MPELPPIFGAPINTTTAGSTPAILPQPVVPTPVAPVASVPAPTNNPAPVVNKAAAPVATKPVATPTSAPAATPTSTTPMVDVYDKSGNKTSVSQADFNTNPFYKNEGYTTTPPTATPPTTTTTTPTVPAEKDSTTKISDILNQGYDSPESIATATGLSLDEVNKLIGSNELLSNKMAINANSNKQEQEYTDYKNKVDSITNGTFALTSSEQADIKAIQDSFDRLRAAQLEANKNYEGTVQTGEIRSGRQEFMNQISGGIYKQALNDGVNKIADIESKAASAIREYKDAVEAKNYKAAEIAYDATQKYLSDKSDTIKQLHTATIDEYKRQQDVIDAANKQITQDLQNQKLKQDIATTTIEGLTPALTGASDEIIQDLAKYYGIDSNLLTGAVVGESQKFEKDMIAKGYRTINPVDADRMRSEGADVVTYSGRAYMKEPELKSFSNKGNVDFFKGTKKVGSTGLTGGGPAVGASSDLTKEEQAFNTDLKNLRMKILDMTMTKANAKKMLMVQYGADSATADSLLTGL